MHSYGGWENVTDSGATKSCECGDTISHSHTFDSASATKLVCSGCGYTMEIECNHNYVQGESYHTGNSSGSCVEAIMTCSLCGDSHTKSISGHNWDHFEFEGVDYMTCIECGAEKEVPIARMNYNSNIMVATVEEEKNKVKVYRI